MKTSRLLLIALLANNIATFSMEEDQDLGSDTESCPFSKSSSKKTALSDFTKQFENLKANEQQTTWDILSNHYKICKAFENSDATAIDVNVGTVIHLWTQCAQQDLNADDSHPGKQLLVEHGVKIAPHIEGAPEKIDSLSHPSILNLFGEEYRQEVTCMSETITKAEEDQTKPSFNKQKILVLHTFHLMKTFAKEQYAVQKPLYTKAKQIFRRKKSLLQAHLPTNQNIDTPHNRTKPNTYQADSCAYM